MAKKVADVMIGSLIAAGVKRIYGISGDSLNGITDSIREHDKDISWVHLRHEETAAFAAGAEAHLTGNIAVCAGSCEHDRLKEESKQNKQAVESKLQEMGRRMILFQKMLVFKGTNIRFEEEYQRLMSQDKELQEVEKKVQRELQDEEAAWDEAVEFGHELYDEVDPSYQVSTKEITKKLEQESKEEQQQR